MILLAAMALVTAQPAPKTAEHKIDHLFAVADTDHNGQLSKAEMIAYQDKKIERKARRQHPSNAK